MKHIFQAGLLVFILVGIISCSTYYIPVESFKEQFNGIDSTSLKKLYQLVAQLVILQNIQPTRLSISGV